MKSAATYAGDPRHHHVDIARLRAERARLRGEAASEYARAEATEQALVAARAKIARIKAEVDR